MRECTKWVENELFSFWEFNTSEIALKFFHYYTQSMQGEPIPHPIPTTPALQHIQPEPLYDFSQCTRIKKLTTHDIYRFQHQNIPLVVKLFAPEALPNYQQEVDYLTKMHHDQVLRVLYKRSAISPNSCEPLERSHMIVMKEATRGDLNDYLPRFGRMSEKMARTYFRQIVEGLSAATRLKPPITHPNLQASSILLGQSGQLYICGWSEISAKEHQVQLQECIFSCGEILICMLTSFMPFYKKYSSTDAFYKFISEQHIHKFWQELVKRMQRVEKTFKFSGELKKMVEGIFLKKITSLEELSNQEWLKGEVYQNAELLKLLEENEKVKLEKLAIRRKQEVASEQNRKKILMELSFGPQRSSQEDEQFITDYQENMIKEEELPQGICSLKVQGSPGFVVACLREFLRQENGKASVLVKEQFVLSNHKIVKVNNCILIDLVFAVSLLEQEQEQEGFLQPVPADTVSLKLKLSFFRNEKQVYAEMEALESNFNSYYTTLAMRFLEDKINRGKQMVQVFSTLSNMKQFQK